MKNEIVLNLRQFPVLVYDSRKDISTEENIVVTVTKDQLQAAQIVGQSSKELIERLCERQGYTAIEIRKPSKVAVAVDLDKLVEKQEEQAKYDYLYGVGGGEAGV